ncbi:uncharacterized protein TRIREDRAFT_55039 [Trichoderma reesei QM6a]|uniref:Predicted protein n=1 Tax=Hypocrea jecorina (strain QM6a) TaxID=431241 RepID=G0RAB2_HYPJQ|nr:uncharacterized protein TRIREDRAFT_55039 [Trichoderma reesei QM6a]EGR52101.1 predicted protein [Trichoderma reesei QM6a]
MSEQPMLEIRTDEAAAGKGIVNLLPCRVQHTGPTGPSSAYWNPNGIKTAYLRGRRLQGKTASLPEGYRGVVLQRKDDAPEPAEQPDVVMIGEDGDEGSAPRLGTMHVMTKFDKMVVWSHDAVADALSDPYLRSVEEWFKVAESVSWLSNLLPGNNRLIRWCCLQIHSYEEEEKGDAK